MHLLATITIATDNRTGAGTIVDAGLYVSRAEKVINNEQ
jgi:hypothetical protein